MLADLDAFYASVEEKDNPAIKGKPVIVGMYSGRGPDSGAVAACNYVARALGVRSGMPLSQAKNLAPDAVFIKADKEKYGTVSDRIMEILESHADVIEQVSIDEAYLDVTTKTKGDYKEAETLAKNIKKTIQDTEKITITIGIGPNKLIAKTASGMQKPDGLTIIPPDKAAETIAALTARKLHGVGPKIEEELNALGAQTIKDIREIPAEKLIETFGEARGRLLFDHCRGLDGSPVLPRVKEQFSRLATLPKNSGDVKEIEPTLKALAGDVHRSVTAEGAFYRQVSLIAVSEGRIHTKNKTLAAPSDSREVLVSEAQKLLSNFLAENPLISIRRIGVRVGELSREKPKQKNLSDFL
ncbi:DNA polymerase IV [uncultured archaeon]|nr:DNA polymerase IV [uncultured archaeon]